MQLRGRQSSGANQRSWLILREGPESPLQTVNRRLQLWREAAAARVMHCHRLSSQHFACVTCLACSFRNTSSRSTCTMGRATKTQVNTPETEHPRQRPSRLLRVYKGDLRQDLHGALLLGDLVPWQRGGWPLSSRGVPVCSLSRSQPACVVQKVSLAHPSSPAGPTDQIEGTSLSAILVTALLCRWPHPSEITSTCNWFSRRFDLSHS